MKQIEVKLNVNSELVKNLLCSAFEGGSNYWIEDVDAPTKAERNKAGAEYLHESPLFGLTLPVNTEDGKKLLTPESLVTGMQIFAEKYPDHFSDMMRENDDATTADVYLQCCLFGDVIYG